MVHRQLPSTRVLLVLVTAVTTVRFGSIRFGEAFLSTVPSSKRGKATEVFSTPQQSSDLNSNSDVDLLRDLPFVPPEVMAKFMAAVVVPLTAGSIQAGYQAGIVSEDDLEQIRTKVPTMQEAAYSTAIPQAQSKDIIEGHWKAALAGQPWHVQTIGKLATSTIVPLVAKLQEKSAQQANAMKWINENALPVIQGNATVVELLSDKDSSNKLLLTFNNTRAKYETDRGVWSASMDVFVTGSGITHTRNDDFSVEAGLSEAGAALVERQEGIGNDAGSIAVLDSSTTAEAVEAITQESMPRSNSNKVGLVNAYFVPNDEIKILVVEIDGILHNVTWKGLDKIILD